MTPEEVRVAFAWLPAEAVDAYLDAYVDSGDDTVAWAQVRQDPRYVQWFPGNLTEDGRPRYSEDVYAAVVASYDDVFRSVGIDGVALDEMREQYGTLIAGDVSPQELESNRVAPMHDRIVIASDAIRAYYSSEFGVDLTLTDLIASAMNPELGNKVLTKQFSLAEIGGEAAESGYNLSSATVNDLFESGKVDKETADRLFQSAENMLPTLQALVARHADPDDDFDINEFIQADIFQDPVQRRRMNRLIAQEKSTVTGGAQLDYLRSRETGGVTGLEVR